MSVTEVSIACFGLGLKDFFDSGNPLCLGERYDAAQTLWQQESPEKIAFISGQRWKRDMGGRFLDSARRKGLP